MKQIRKIVTFKICEKIFTTIIKSIIDYGSMFYCNTTLQNLQKIEKLYYHSALICTKAYKNTNRVKLLKEINWDTFSERCKYLSMTMFAKIKFTKTPSIIYEQFPFSTTLRHSDRYKNNLQQLLSRRNHFYNSFFVKMFREWNKLPSTIKNTGNYEDFKNLLKNQQDININNYTYENYQDTIYLSFRMQNSLLQSDKYKMGISENNLCINCPTGQQETLFHFVFECPKYKYYRQNFLNQIKTIAKLKNVTRRNLLHLLLNNNNQNFLHPTEYKFIINKFTKYIEKTKRFI